MVCLMLIRQIGHSTVYTYQSVDSSSRGSDRSFVQVSICTGMALSARNRLTGTVQSVTTGDIMAEVVIELPDGQTITSTITRGSADRLELAEGDEVEAVIKASEVMVNKD